VIARLPFKEGILPHSRPLKEGRGMSIGPKSYTKKIKWNCQGDRIIFSLQSQGNNRVDLQVKTKSLKSKIVNAFF